jgi:hypothetical protein
MHSGRSPLKMMPASMHPRGPGHVLSLTMIIVNSASRNAIQNPGVRCWNVPESLPTYFASMVTFWSSESLPACLHVVAGAGFEPAPFGS